MEFSGKMCFKMILRVTKKFHHLFRRYIFRKTTGQGVNLTPPSCLELNLTLIERQRFTQYMIHSSKQGAPSVGQLIICNDLHTQPDILIGTLYIFMKALKLKVRLENALHKNQSPLSRLPLNALQNISGRVPLRLLGS